MKKQKKSDFGEHMSSSYHLMNFGKIPNNPNIQQVKGKNND